MIEWLSDEIKNKTVAIVGNAQSIFNHKYGAEIDDHDVIIRFNRGFVTEPKAQGTKTDILILACELNTEEKSRFKAKYYINRSARYKSGDYTFPNEIRRRLKQIIGAQPSSGFMAIDYCRQAGAKKIDLYGFDFEATPTFYNPAGYQTKHNYAKEKQLIGQFNDVEVHNG